VGLGTILSHFTRFHVPLARACFSYLCGRPPTTSQECHWKPSASPPRTKCPRNHPRRGSRPGNSPLKYLMTPHKAPRSPKRRRYSTRAWTRPSPPRNQRLYRNTQPTSHLAEPTPAPSTWMHSILRWTRC